VPAAAIAALRAFDGLYGQDAYAYFDYAVVSVRHSVLHLAPLEAFFWPPGYPLVVALASLAFGTVPYAGQAVSLVMGALVPVFTALLVRELWPDEPSMALLAGASAAVCGQLWQSSVVVMSDTLGLALAAFSAWALARYGRDGALGWLLAASSAIACATLTRWIYGLVALPFAIYALSSLRGRGHALLALALGGAIVLPVAVPQLLQLVSRPGESAAFVGNFQVYSWSPLNALRHDFLTADGHLRYSLSNGVYYAIAPANLAFFGPVLAAFALFGLWTVRRWPRPHIALIVGWAAIVYVFHAGAPWQNFRFTLAYVPPLAILAAAGILESRRFTRVRGVVVAGAALALLIAVGGAVRLESGFIDRKDDELALARWVQANTPPDAQLLSFGPTLTFRHYTTLPTYDLYDLSADDLHTVLGSPKPEFVVLDETNVEDQWLGQPPANTFHLLRDGPGLSLVDLHGPYTLYRVGSAR
jgi:hypothetical protein